MRRTVRRVRQTQIRRIKTPIRQARPLIPPASSPSPLTSSVGETNQQVQINTSEHITTDEGKTTLGSPDNTSDIGSDLVAFRAIYGSSSEGSTTTSPVGNFDDVDMEANTSPNQSENSLQGTGTNQTELSSDLTDLLDGDSSSKHITSEEKGSEQPDP